MPDGITGCCARRLPVYWEIRLAFIVGRAMRESSSICDSISNWLMISCVKFKPETYDFSLRVLNRSFISTDSCKVFVFSVHNYITSTRGMNGHRQRHSITFWPSISEQDAIRVLRRDSIKVPNNHFSEENLFEKDFHVERDYSFAASKYSFKIYFQGMV